MVHVSVTEEPLLSGFARAFDLQYSSSKRRVVSCVTCESSQAVEPIILLHWARVASHTWEMNIF